MIAAITGLPRFLDEIEHALPESAGPFGVDRGRMREFADVGAGDEGLVACAGEDDAAHCGVVSRIFEGGAKVRPCWRIERVEHLWTVERHIGNTALLVVQHVLESKRGRLLGRHLRSGRSHSVVSCPGFLSWRSRYTKALNPVIALPMIRFCIW